MKALFAFLSIGFLLFQASGWGLAQDQEVVTTGKYVMGDLDSKKDARNLALLEAKQAALEAAGTYLKTVSKVKDYQLTRDEISSLASGMLSVTILEEKWTMEGENPAVTVRIKARVRTDDLDRQVKVLREDEGTVQDYKAMQAELASLKRDLEELKREAAQKPNLNAHPAARQEITRKKEEILGRIGLMQLLETAEQDFRWGRFQEAEEGISEALKRAPDNAKIRLKHALILLKMERFLEAGDEVNRALRQAPDDWQAHALNGWIHLKTGRLETAVRAFSRAIRLNDRCGRCYLGRGIALNGLKMIKKAHIDFSKACELGKRKGCEKARQLEKKRRGLLKAAPLFRRPHPQRSFR